MDTKKHLDFKLQTLQTKKCGARRYTARIVLKKLILMNTFIQRTSGDHQMYAYKLSLYQGCTKHLN